MNYIFVFYILSKRYFVIIENNRKIFVEIRERERMYNINFLFVIKFHFSKKFAYIALALHNSDNLLGNDLEHSLSRGRRSLYEIKELKREQFIRVHEEAMSPFLEGFHHLSRTRKNRRKY